MESDPLAPHVGPTPGVPVTGHDCAKPAAASRRRGYGRRVAAPPPANNSVRRTYDLLRAELPSMPSDKLLVEEELIGSLSASRNTVRVVLQLLAAQGLVKRGPKVGTTVESLVLLPISELTTMSDVRAGSIETRVLESLVIPAPALIRERLELETGAPVAVIEGLLLDGIVPMALSVSYVALPAGYEHGLGLGSPEVVSILEDELDVQLGDSDVLLAAVECDAQTAGLLGVREGSPVMWLEDLLRDHQGVPRALSQIRYRADRVTFTGRARRRTGMA